MGSSYGGRGSAVTGIFVRNWIKADGSLKPQTSVIRFSPLYTDWRMIALDDTGAEKHRQKQARFEQCEGTVILSDACTDAFAWHRPQSHRIHLKTIWVIWSKQQGSSALLQIWTNSECVPCRGDRVRTLSLDQHHDVLGFFILSFFALCIHLLFFCVGVCCIASHS